MNPDRWTLLARRAELLANTILGGILAVLAVWILATDGARAPLWALRVGVVILLAAAVAQAASRYAWWAARRATQRVGSGLRQRVDALGEHLSALAADVAALADDMATHAHR